MRGFLKSSFILFALYTECYKFLFFSLFKPVRPTDLKSRTWCDTIFEHRNKEYGAYRLRQQAGARYRYALTFVFSFFFLFAAGYTVYLHFMRKQVRTDLAEAEKALARMIPSELNNGYQIRMIATARTVTPVSTPGEGEKLQGVPEITDKVVKQMSIGVKKAIRFTPHTEWTDENATDLVPEQHEETDILVKQKIIQTNDVSELPEFPGGARQFLLWLDQNIAYPPYCLKRGIEGEVTISFIVREDGYAEDFKIVNASNELFAQAAINVLKRMPQWKAAKNPEGKPTMAMITVPILFRR